MKRLIQIAIAIVFGAPMLAFAQVESPAAPASSASSLTWYKLGSSFGGSSAWQFGLNMDPMPASGCLQRELHDGQWLAGPCRKILLLAKQQSDGSFRSIFHVGAYALANTERANWAYGPMAGVDVVGASAAALGKVAGNLPYVEGLLDWTPPPFISYINNILTVDFGVAYRPNPTADVKGHWTYGPMVTLNIPLDDVIGLLRTGL